MKKVFELFLLDWKRIFKSKAATLLMLALLIIPSLYCWFNVWALWDPYSNTADLQVAVYSADKPVTFQKQQVAIGDQLVDQLHKNKKLGWRFVDSKAAVADGVRSGKYYAGIYVPKNFSGDLMSFVEGKIQKPELTYYVNEKINAVAPKLTGTGASTLQATIGTEFQETVAGTLMKAMNKAGVDLDANLPMMRRMASLLLDTNKNLPELDKYVAQAKQLQTDMPAIKAKLKEANAMTAYLPEVNKLAKKIVAVNGYLPQVESAGALATSVAGKIPEIKRAGTQLQTVNNDFDTISGTLDSAITTATGALTVLDKVDSALPAITRAGKDAQGAVATAKDDIIPQIDKALPAVNTAAVSGLALLTSLNGTLTTKMTNISSDLTALKNDADSQAARTALVNELASVATNAQTGADTATSLANALTKLQTAYNNAASGKQDNTLTAGITRLQNVATILTQLSVRASALSADAKSASVDQLQAKVDALAVVFAKFTAADKALAGMNLDTKVAKFNQQFKQLLADTATSLATLNTSVMPKLPGLLKNTKQVVKNAVQLLTKYQKQMPALKQELADANTLLNGHMDEITTGLTTVSAMYKNDYPTLKNKLGLATSFINNDLPGIEDELTTTLGQLNTAMPKAEKALTEANKLLDADWPLLRTGITKGAKLVAEGKKSVDFNKLIKLLKRDAGKESDFLANPVTLKTKSYYSIPTYGSASAPFYTALCMWVGGLLLSSILVTDIALDEKQKRRYGTKAKFTGRFLTFAVIGLLQALIVALGNMFLIHAFVAQPFMFILMSLFLDLMFMGILYPLVSLFGNVGKGLGIIILVLSISGAGANFPIQLSGHFFRMINPWLPFTYAVNLIRETVGGIYWPNMWQDIIVLTLYGVGFFLAGLLLKQPIEPLMNKLHANAVKSKIIH
ncbi:YhgE/Pip domain-containing protein [Lacticaseibacillus sharpeae]|uniref:Phage infection protein n=1 Tax=Lacticaseibacillus sharpeae JCM 1186 = DSM 20505 TaxID=1291052 RepID=A0A0R1ZM85_9LACO|nr:YhgE/Pip domain-containing protein [Lacticaseibacillus sharpeae]KRM56110.1 phage infection protein [Lacticaseibacillus sharpeae JCM 1186 = DSM 20505]